MSLPNEPQGFAVNVFTREIHKRHARHALDLRRTTPGGLAGILHGQDPVLCEECFGAPKPERKAPTRFSAEPVKVVEGRPAKKSLSTASLKDESPAAEERGNYVRVRDTTADGFVLDGEDVEEPDGPPDEG